MGPVPRTEQGILTRRNRLRTSRWQPGRERGGIFLNLIVLLCLVVFCLAIYLVRRPILRYIAEAWVIDEPFPHADAIIVIGDDNFYGDRATKGVELYRQDVAPVVVASGRWLRPKASLGEVIQHDLIDRGVPADKVLRFDHNAPDTIQEAAGLAKFAEQKHWTHVIVVTSNYHTRRVLYIYERVFPTRIAVSVASARDAEFDPQHWWEKKKSTALFTHEFVGMLDALWELRGRERNVSAGTLLWPSTSLPWYEW
jgi:uncharacterized SAM-binding protein YcdF (DUF218 family)